MKKAVIIGGANGIGLAISDKLIKTGYHTIILDKTKPNSIILKNNYEYIYSDLLQFEDSIFENLASDLEIEIVMITAGLGRVAEFASLSSAEIKKIITVNAESGIRIAKHFYNRIKGVEPFYFGMMGSIAGLVSSPMFSVYAASKAAICRFIESVNIELEMSGTSNRILDISPGSIEGTRFNGGQNDLQLLEELSSHILEHLFNHDELFIPKYIEIYKGVIERYHDDPHKYGLESYNYKKKSDRINKKDQIVIGYLSGTFDLFHIGHLNILKKAKSQCDYLIVGVHDSGKWKGKETFIPLEERKAIVGSCKYVDKVVDSCKEDSDAWNLWHYNKLFVGSDYKGTERFNRYEKVLSEKGVRIVYLPYTKNTSSTQIRNAISKNNE